MVGAVMTYKLEEEDRLVKRLAYQAAGVMLSSGNMKKSANVESVTESIYMPLVAETPEEAPQRETLDKDAARQFVEQLENKMSIN